MVKRISIIGGGGTGKTTLSLRLSKIFNLPVYHIDGIKYLPEWHKRSDIERFEILNKYIQEEKWITLYKTKRKWYLDLLKTQNDTKVLIFKNRKQLNKYLDTIQKKRWLICIKIQHQ